jgi:NAD(P)-dependent dehydrogenase (short-subunit alcohol dehydrogenase family)
MDPGAGWVKSIVDRASEATRTEEKILRRNAERAASLRTFAADTPGEAIVVDLDILKEDSCSAAIAIIMERDGRIDAVFHNAGHLYIVCVPKIRFCNIDDEGRQGQAGM